MSRKFRGIVRSGIIASLVLSPSRVNLSKTGEDSLHFSKNNNVRSYDYRMLKFVIRGMILARNIFCTVYNYALIEEKSKVYVYVIV